MTWQVRVAPDAEPAPDVPTFSRGNTETYRLRRQLSALAEFLITVGLCRRFHG